jgi:hypothetical protein
MYSLLALSKTYKQLWNNLWPFLRKLHHEFGNESTDGQHGDDEPGYQARGLDAEKKTLGASERREEERVQWREQMKQVDANHLVVVDECGSNIALTPFYMAGQIVVLGNLSVHNGARVRQLIEERGCELLFLPAFSPDYSQIEETFSKVKAFLRRVGARTQEALQDTIGLALETVTARDAHGWFMHCGCLSAQASNL